jgi:hypothetical protein
MSSDNWFGHQSRFVRPRSDRNAAGSLPGSFNGLPLVFASIFFLSSREGVRVDRSSRQRKRLRSISEIGKIDQRGASTANPCFRLEPPRVSSALFPNRFKQMEHQMIGKLIGAKIGQKLAGRNREGSGAMLGMLVPVLGRRLFGPLGLALGAGYVAKKVWDRRQAARTTAKPAPASAAA